MNEPVVVRRGAQDERRAAARRSDEDERLSRLVDGQGRALRLTMQGAPLDEVLHVVTDTLSSALGQGTGAAVMLLDDSAATATLRYAAGNLPRGFASMLGELPIGPRAGGCGTAVYRGRPVVVGDVAADELWHGRREVALEHGFRANVSFPVFAADGRVLGTLAAYFPVVRRPSPQDYKALELLTDTTALLVGRELEARHRQSAEAGLRESEGKFKTLVDHMSQLAWMADADGSLFWFNQRWFEYTGTSFDEVKGRGWITVHHPEHVGRVVARLQRAWDTGEEWEDQFPLRGADGQYRWFLSRAVPIRGDDGKVFRWFGTSTDITEQRQLEDAMREADRRKDAFLATLAHELRNPLAPLSNALFVLKATGQETEESARLHEMMRRQLGQLVRLVDDLLEVSRITRGIVELQRERVVLADVVRSAVETSASLISSGRHQLSVTLPDEEVVLDADPVRLAQVFANLLNNAAKYTERGGQIALSAALSGRYVVVTVKDNGVGIPEPMLARVFEMFVQGETTRFHAQGGLGIGLTLVRSLVRLHGGTVKAMSEGPGKGTEMVVRLPVVEAAAGREQPAGPQPVVAAAASLSVLVVDDNKDATDSLAALLRALGAEVRVAYGGFEALEQMEAREPDVVFLDLGMPGMDGYEVARRVRGRAPASAAGGEGEEARPGPRLIALTGWGQEEDRRRSRAAGFDEHLVKPITLEDVQAVLAAV